MQKIASEPEGPEALFPLFRWWLYSMAAPKQHQAVLDGIKTRVQSQFPLFPLSD